MLIDIIAGARPNFVKVAAIIRSLPARTDLDSRLTYRLVHTGQHYDERMSGSFFSQLGIPTPDINLEVGSGSPAEQTAAIMMRYERVLVEKPPGLCLVVGDVNSTMACAITAKKMGVPVAHVEAGIRSWDWAMPEEVNRVVTDSLCDWFFTTSVTAGENLFSAGISQKQVFFVGNTMVDTLLANLSRLRRPALVEGIELQEGRYFVLTLHRPSNVDSLDRISSIISMIATSSRGFPVVFPVHPRTAAILKGLGGIPANIHLVEPQPYLEFNWLVKHAMAVVTDSGGVSEETTVLGIPCLTMRDSTERPETVSVGTNELMGTDPGALGLAFEKLFCGKWKKGGIPDLWDGMAGSRIVSVLEELL